MTVYICVLFRFAGIWNRYLDGRWDKSRSLSFLERTIDAKRNGFDNIRNNLCDGPVASPRDDIHRIRVSCSDELRSKFAVLCVLGRPVISSPWKLKSASWALSRFVFFVRVARDGLSLYGLSLYLLISLIQLALKTKLPAERSVSLPSVLSLSRTSFDVVILKPLYCHFALMIFVRHFLFPAKKYRTEMYKRTIFNITKSYGNFDNDKSEELKK